jgi:hypothetical protein
MQLNCFNSYLIIHKCLPGNRNTHAKLIHAGHAPTPCLMSFLQVRLCQRTQKRSSDRLNLLPTLLTLLQHLLWLHLGQHTSSCASLLLPLAPRRSPSVIVAVVVIIIIAPRARLFSIPLPLALTLLLLPALTLPPRLPAISPVPTLLSTVVSLAVVLRPVAAVVLVALALSVTM